MKVIAGKHNYYASAVAKAEFATTGVTDLGVGKAVASQTYVTPSGIVSATPVAGVNVVVTVYTDGTYRDRLIDIDLIFAHPLTIATLTNNHLANDPLTDDTFADDSAPGITYCCPTLTLPHPRAFEREFVMAPIRELHPLCPNYPRLLGKIVPYDKA